MTLKKDMYQQIIDAALDKICTADIAQCSAILEAYGKTLHCFANYH